jgi:hypothetical protein
MHNFFFAPSKATPESPSYLLHLQALGKVRCAEANKATNEDLIRRLARSAHRVDVDSASVIITAPTENRFENGGTQLRVGRGVYEIADYALSVGAKVFIIRQCCDEIVFYPVIHINRGAGGNDWKVDYAVCVIEPMITASVLMAAKAPYTPPLTELDDEDDDLSAAESSDLENA